MKKVYIAAYHQSKFGKLMAMTMPEIVAAAVAETLRRDRRRRLARSTSPRSGPPATSRSTAQGLLAGLVAMMPGLGAKPIEAVENACASGGQAVLSVIQKLQSGHGEIGLAVGYEKMRNDEGKMDGKP